MLSYPLSSSTPVYGKLKKVEITYDKAIARGDSCNIASIALCNHGGTHIDAPKHFDDRGRSLYEYGIEELIFIAPYLLDCPKGQDEMVLPEELTGIDKKCDILLIRTGFHRFREQEIYRLHNPGISPQAAEYLCANYPNLRAIGIDSLSISAFQRREEGRLAHQVLLTRDRPVLLIEDLKLTDDVKGLKRVFAVPLFVEGIDSLACTVIGEVV